MKPILYTFFLIFLSLSATAQVEEVNYLFDYNCETNLYEVKIKIVSGSATTIPQRAQFNSQITVVVPTGNLVEIVELIAPLENNQSYDSDVPTKWVMGASAIAPESAPNFDFYPLQPTLAPASFYNDIYENDEVLLFTLKIGEGTEYNDQFRFFNNGSDPSEIGTTGGDFRNGFTLGGTSQLYMGNEYKSCLTSTSEEVAELMTAYPSPFKNEINIQLSNDATAVSIVDASGALVYSDKQVNTKKLRIPTVKFHPGIYFVQVETPRGIQSQKVIKL